MEITSRFQDRVNHNHSSPMNSPRTSNVSNCMSSSNSNNGIPLPTPPLTPKTSSSRSDSNNNPYPTTFVQADTTTFKQVVQMLTGSPSSETSTKPPPQDPIPPPSRNFNIPPIKSAPKKQPGFKLYERRNSLKKNSLMINTLMPNFASNSGFSPRKPEILSPSLLDFPSLALSPVTPLNDDDPFDNKSSPSLGNSSSSEEDKAIAEKGFYLHPSPMTTPRDAEPQLLPLFPLTSPRVHSGTPS